jgi:hypothetical protein
MKSVNNVYVNEKIVVKLLLAGKIKEISIILMKERAVGPTIGVLSSLIGRVAKEQDTNGLPALY